MQISGIRWSTVITSAICIFSLILVKEVIDPRTRPKIKVPIPIELFVVSLSVIFLRFTFLHIRSHIKGNYLSLGSLLNSGKLSTRPQGTLWCQHGWGDSNWVSWLSQVSCNINDSITLGAIIALPRTYSSETWCTVHCRTVPCMATCWVCTWQPSYKSRESNIQFLTLCFPI